VDNHSSPAAHQVCPYSNATRGNVDVTLIANGAPV
jgi:osmotically inducible protein OsmC